jgi:nanoRNase/pAp phosphatase (c-di-AMP/oligoRNAs hydrolase)
LELHFGGRFAMVAVTEEELRCAGASEEDTEVLNDIPRRIAGVQMSAVIKPKGNLVKCSFRSSEDIDVAALSQTQNGGGHFHAAGFSKENATVAQVRELVLSMVEGVLL